MNPMKYYDMQGNSIVENQRLQELAQEIDARRLAQGVSQSWPSPSEQQLYSVIAGNLHARVHQIRKRAGRWANFPITALILRRNKQWS